MTPIKSQQKQGLTKTSPSKKQDRLSTHHTTNETSSPSFKLSHPHKMLYPEDNISKENLADYYKKIQKWILPFIKNRPLTLVRCPHEYKECFYQKHMTSSVPDSLQSITIKEKTKTSDYIYLKNTAGLLVLMQLNVLEIHPWGSLIEDIEHPDMIIFDLDPSPGVAWEKVVEAAKDVQKELLKFKLKSFVKTTGGKGLHVVAPIKPEHTWEEIKKFSHSLVDFLIQHRPNEYTNALPKAKRKGKIFIDYLRNQRGATAIAPYCTRAKLSAPVATPLAWDELTPHKEDTHYTIKTLPIRLKKLKKDPWENFFKIQQSLDLKNTILSQE